jgi:hypothetical protein
MKIQALPDESCRQQAPIWILFSATFCILMENEVLSFLKAAFIKKKS